MREIKFRGKTEQSGKWVYGHLIYWAGDYQIWETETNGKTHNYSVIPETVGEFIGLKDKNGVDVYEGDIYYKEDSYKNLFNRKTWFKISFEKGCFYEEVIKAENTLEHKSTQIGVYKVGDMLLLSKYNNDDFLHFKVIDNISDNTDILTVPS